MCGNVGSKKLFIQGCTMVQGPVWLGGRVNIYVNVLRVLHIEQSTLH